MRHLIITIIILIIYSLTAKADRVDIPFILNNGLMIIEVAMDGQLQEFVFDTGTNDIIIHQSDSQVSDHTVTTLDGVVATGTYKIEEMHIGSLKKTNITATTMDLSFVNQFLNKEIGGMIGSAIFSPSMIYIDFENQVITLDKEIESPQYVFAHKLDYVLSDGVPMTNISIGDQEYAVILDSGATNHFFDPKVMTVSFDKPSPQVYTATGSNEQNYGFIQDVTIGNMDQEILTGVSKDFTDFNIGATSSMIGLLSLKKLAGQGSMYFDTKQQVLYF